jgi:hypothetical protein
MKIRTVCKMTRSRALNDGVFRALIAASLMVVLFMLTPLGGFAQQASPSLEETTTYMTSFLANHGCATAKLTGGGPNENFTRTITNCAAITHIDKCMVEMKWYNAVAISAHGSVDLSRLDPESIKSVPAFLDTPGLSTETDGVLVTAYATDTKGGVSFFIDGSENATHLIKALVHAITLCGGKKGAF